MVIIELQCSLGIPQHFLDINVLFMEGSARRSQYYLVLHVYVGYHRDIYFSFVGYMYLNKYQISFILLQYTRSVPPRSNMCACK